MVTTVVCGIDGSDESFAAANIGLAIAEAVDATGVLVHAVPDASIAPRGVSAQRERRARHAREAAERLLAIVARGRRNVERRVVEGGPVGGLLDVAAETDAAIVAVGSRGHGPVRSALLGSTSRSVLRDAACSVLVVPPRALEHATGGDSIVCGVDGSHEAEQALAIADRLRRLLDRRLVLVHVSTPDAALAVSPGSGPPVFVQRDRVDRSRRAATELIDRATERAGVSREVEARLDSGDAASVLDAAAEDEDAALITVGIGMGGPMDGMGIGSVASRLATSASRPVLLVRSGGPDRLG